MRKFLFRISMLIIYIYAFSIAVVVGLGWRDGDIVSGFIVADYLLVRGPVIRFFDPVESDEKMIEKFTNKRSVFDELIESNKIECSPDFENVGANKTIKANPELMIIKVRRSNQSVWLPFPYSKEALHQRRKTDEDISKSAEQLLSSGPDLSSALKRHDDMIRSKKCKYSATFFYTQEMKGSGFKKGYVYFPEAPLIENGEIYFPSNDVMNLSRPTGKVVSAHRAWIYRSPRDGCTFRKIEMKWFLFVCPS